MIGIACDIESVFASVRGFYIRVRWYSTPCRERTRNIPGGCKDGGDKIRGLDFSCYEESKAAYCSSIARLMPLMVS